MEPWPLHGGVMEMGEMEKMHDEFEKEQDEKDKMHDEFKGDACSDISEGSVVLFQGVCCRFRGTFWAQDHTKNPDTVSGGWKTWRACATGGSNSARMEFDFASWRKVELFRMGTLRHGVESCWTLACKLGHWGHLTWRRLYIT